MEFDELQGARWRSRGERLGFRLITIGRSERGPCGEIMRAAKRSVMRPQHVHFWIHAQRYVTLDWTFTLASALGQQR